MEEDTGPEVEVGGGNPHVGFAFAVDAADREDVEATGPKIVVQVHPALGDKFDLEVLVGGDAADELDGEAGGAALGVEERNR